MNPRLKKEFRVLAPYAIAAILTALAVGIWVDVANPVNVAMHRMIVLTIHFILFLMMSVLIFGAEFSDKTMERLLAQPMSRVRLWREKMGILLVMLAALVIFDVIIQHWITFEYVKAGAALRGEDFQNYWKMFPIYNISFYLFVTTSALALLAFSSGPLMVLYLRQSHVAFWAALVAPVFLFVLFMGIDSFILLPIFKVSLFVQIQIRFGDAGEVSIPSMIWALIAYFLARRRFMTLEV